MTTTIIIGGGVAGLTAATQLAARGLRPVILEADPAFVGGRLRGGPPVELADADGRRWSFPGEHGVHGIWSPYLNLKALLARHAIMPALVPSREETWIFGRGSKVQMAAIGSAIRRSPVPAPFHYLFLLTRPRLLNMLSVWDFLSLVRVEGTLFSAMAIDPLAEGQALDGMMLADFTRGWTPTVRSLFAGLARNALAAHPEAVPVAGFIAFLRFYTLLRRDAWDFGYLPGTGGECIAEPLAAAAGAAGAEIRLGCRVTRLERAGDLWEIVYTDAQGQQQAQRTDRVVLALDAPAARTLLLNSPPTAAVAAGLRFPTGVPTLIVRLWFRASPRAIAASGICTGDLLVDNFFWLQQLQPAYQAWHAATGGSALETHIYGPAEVLAQPDAALLTQVIHDTYRAFPELRGSLLHSVVLRNDATHTLFTPGDPACSLAVQTPWPGMVACGDWIADANPAMYLERAATTGMVAANYLLRELGLAAWPILEHPAPEWFAGKLAALLTRFRRAMIERRRTQKQSARRIS
jgi:isorenieratene synthase